MTTQQTTALQPDWRERLEREECPRCGEPLDTGWECAVTSKRCGFDAFLLVQTEEARPQ